MRTPEQELAESVIAAAAENTKPTEEQPETAQAEPVGDFRHNLLRMADLADLAVRETRQTRLENAALRARHEQERAAHARTLKMLEAAEAAAVELRQQLSESRDSNTRLRAHMEAMGNNMLNATRIQLAPQVPVGSAG